MRVTVPKGGLPPRSRRVMNLAHFLLQSAKRYPSEIALVSGEDTLTWAQLNARVDAMAAALAVRGVSKGDRILVQAKNSNQLFRDDVCVLPAWGDLGADELPPDRRGGCLSR
jgi:fatty-acyl-CoA synthase